MIPNTTRTRSTPIYVGEFCYKIQDLLGTGYSSKVYKGKRMSAKGQDVAVKVINMHNITEPIHRMLLESELQTLNKMKGCQNILIVHDIIRPSSHQPNNSNQRNEKPASASNSSATYRESFAPKNSSSVANNTPTAKSIIPQSNPLPHCYIISELCKSDLSQKLKPKIGYIVAQKYIRQILTGFKQLYEHGIIHRDLKPANLFIDCSNNIKIGDFGFAIPVKDAFKQSRYNIGSPLYMAPETLRRNQYSFGTDIWAIGIIIFEMLVGDTPWKAESEKQLYQKIQKTTITEILSGVSLSIMPNQVRDLVARMLVFNKKERITPEDIFVSDVMVKRSLRYMSSKRAESSIADSQDFQPAMRKEVASTIKVQQNLVGSMRDIEALKHNKKHTHVRNKSTTMTPPAYPKKGLQNSEPDPQVSLTCSANLPLNSRKSISSNKTKPIPTATSRYFAAATSRPPLLKKNTITPFEVDMNQVFQQQSNQNQKVSQQKNKSKEAKSEINEEKQVPEDNKIIMKEPSIVMKQSKKEQKQIRTSLEVKVAVASQTEEVLNIPHKKSTTATEATQSHFDNSHVNSAGPKKNKTTNLTTTKPKTSTFTAFGSTEFKKEEKKERNTQQTVSKHKNQLPKTSNTKPKIQQVVPVSLTKEEIKDITKVLVSYIHMCRLLFKVLTRLNTSIKRGFIISQSLSEVKETTAGGIKKFSVFPLTPRPSSIRNFSFLEPPAPFRTQTQLPPPEQTASHSPSFLHEHFMLEIEKLSKHFCNIISKNLSKVKNLHYNNFLDLPEEVLDDYINPKNDFKKVQKVCQDYIGKYSRSEELGKFWVKREDPNYKTSINVVTNLVKLLWPQLNFSEAHEEQIILLDYLLFSRQVLEKVGTGAHYDNRKKIEGYVDSTPEKPNAETFKQLINRAKKVCIIDSNKY